MALSIPLATKIAVHTAIKNLIDADASPGYVEIKDASDDVLSTLPLDYPCGTVSGTTGQLVIDIGARDEEAALGGTAATADICDGAGTVVFTLDCSAGTAPVADTAILTSLTIVAGAPVEINSLTIG